MLGVLLITTEYTTGMIRSSLLAEPRRTPLLAAKAAVFAVIAFAAGELLSPWQGFGVLCLWTAALLAAAGFLLTRRDA